MINVRESGIPQTPTRGAGRFVRRAVLWVGLLGLAAWLGASPVACRPGGMGATSQPAVPVAAGPVVPVQQAIPATNPSQINLLLFGDWGRNSQPEREVAHGIRAYAATNNVQFDAGLLLGDNFYVPLTGVDDPRWRTLFEDLYEPASLRFWAVLGNHDYGTPAGPRPNPAAPGKSPPGPRLKNKDVELEYARLHPGGRFNLPARWYRLDLPAGDPTVTILMLDSNYRDSGLSPDDWRRETQWLAAQLDDVRPPGAAPGTQARRRWVICCAHHPVFTNGRNHGDDARLKKEWLPLMESHAVDFYLTGHNHCMEHLWIAESTVSHVVNGGGGATLYSEYRRHPGWYARAYGFTHLTLRPDGATVRYVDKDGHPLYEFTRDSAGTEHHPPTTHPATLPAQPPATSPAPIPLDDADEDEMAP